MASWLNDYMLAIAERDREEKAEHGLYNKYTRLADRVVTHHSISKDQQATIRNEVPNSKNSGKLVDTKVNPPRFADIDAFQKALQDLGEAQRSKGAMEIQLQLLTDQTKKLVIKTEADSKRIAELMSERTYSAARMRDREEELRGKAKLLEDVHDETVSLTLQLNMAEEQSQMLKRENKELVDRWMARMGEEADAMNKASRFS